MARACCQPRIACIASRRIRPAAHICLRHSFPLLNVFIVWVSPLGGARLGSRLRSRADLDTRSPILRRCSSSRNIQTGRAREMASSSLSAMNITVEPDLQPIYPTPAQLSHLLSPHVGLSPAQKTELINHCLTRSCVFGDINLLSYLLSDPHAQPYVDLSRQDEDGMGLIIVTILGFGSENERDLEREECVRLLIAEGADVNLPDQSAFSEHHALRELTAVIVAGWTALHHAALLASPTLVSHLLARGCSPFAQSRRGLTALDIVTAHSIMPGREDVRLLLEVAMREQGWTGGRMEERRKALERRNLRSEKRRALQDNIGRILDIHPSWWPNTDMDVYQSDSDEDDDEEIDETNIYVRASKGLSLSCLTKSLNHRHPLRILLPCSSLPHILCLTYFKH